MWLNTSSVSFNKGSWRFCRQMGSRRSYATPTQRADRCASSSDVTSKRLSWKFWLFDSPQMLSLHARILRQRLSNEQSWSGRRALITWPASWRESRPARPRKNAMSRPPKQGSGKPRLSLLERVRGVCWTQYVERVFRHPSGSYSTPTAICT